MPLHGMCLRPHSRNLWNDASGNAPGNILLKIRGKHWRTDFLDDVPRRLRRRSVGRDLLSINVLEVLGMVVTAWLGVHSR